jgi:hypothetical protein
MAYSNSPFNRVPMLLPGVVSYSFGSFSDTIPTTELLISNVSLTTDVATITGAVISGNIPLANQLISIQGTQTASGAFNVTNVAITSASITATTGAGTIVFPLTHADVVSTPDAGQALIVPVATPATLANGSGQQFAIRTSHLGNAQHGLGMTWNVLGSPSAGTLALQIADVDQDAAYEAVATGVSVNTTASGTVYFSDVTANFARLNLSAVSGGTAPTITAGILLS